jgi:hypothetical protein
MALTWDHPAGNECCCYSCEQYQRDNQQAQGRRPAITTFDAQPQSGIIEQRCLDAPPCNAVQGVIRAQFRQPRAVLADSGMIGGVIDILAMWSRFREAIVPVGRDHGRPADVPS